MSFTWGWDRLVELPWRFRRPAGCAGYYCDGKEVSKIDAKAGATALRKALSNLEMALEDQCSLTRRSLHKKRAHLLHASRVYFLELLRGSCLDFLPLLFLFLLPSLLGSCFCCLVVF